MQKKAISTIREKNRIIANIINAITDRRHFLILGHNNPDEDCISAMTAFALIITKFSGTAKLFIGNPVHEHFSYLVNMCRYNSIDVMESDEPVTDPIDTIVICDTPKPEMIRMNPSIEKLMSDPLVVKIEIDHHLGGDGAYCGDPDYSLVTEASAACELLGHVTLKMSSMKTLLNRYGISDLFSRNLTLAILSGIIGDSQMGKFLKSRKERRYYDLFSTKFNDLLQQQTVNKSNFSSKEEVFGELQRLSANEEQCFTSLMGKRQLHPSFSSIILGDNDLEQLVEMCGYDVFSSVSRSVVNTLAEESGRFGLIAFLDPVKKDLFQFRMRRSKQFKQYDLRRILPLFSIENGGGHEGAIGFRVPSDTIQDIGEYCEMLMSGIDADLKKALQY